LSALRQPQVGKNLKNREFFLNCDSRNTTKSQEKLREFKLKIKKLQKNDLRLAHLDNGLYETNKIG